MRGSWKITRIAGIDVSLHWTFGLLMAWVVLAAMMSGGVATAINEALFVSLLFGCVVLHELGHALAARTYGIPTNGITLLPIGGVAQLARIPRNPGQELVIALAGPAVNVVIAAFLLVILSVAAGLAQVTSMSLLTGGLLPRLLAVNIMLVVFNLIPAFPMDGGRVLRAVLAMVVEYSRATYWAARVGQGTALLLAIVGFAWNPMLLLIAGFVALAAEAELRQVMAEEQQRSRGSVWSPSQNTGSPGNGVVIEGNWRPVQRPPEQSRPVTATVVWPTDSTAGSTRL